MKKIIAAIILCIFIIQLTACGLNSEEKHTGTLRLKDSFDNSVTEIKVDSEKVYFADGDMLAFQSDLSVDDMKNSLAKSNPDFSFNVLDDKQILMTSKANYPYTLFSKNVVDKNENPLDDVYVVVNESAAGNRNSEIICLPYHLIKKPIIFSEDNGQYSLNSNIHDPYYNMVELQSSPTIFTDIAAFYQDCGYNVQYEGGNTSGGCIRVFESAQNPLESPRPLYRILVMSNGRRYFMQFCDGTDIHELKAAEVVEKYVEALNKKDAKAYLSCYEVIDDKSVDVFVNNVKSCQVNCDLFWRDQSRGEIIIKVNRTLISEDGKLMGSYGTGEVDCTDYWLVRIMDDEPKIICQYENFADTVSELRAYKEFENHETEVLVDWLFSIASTE